MKAVVLALTLAFVAGQSPNFAPEFAVGKTYVYKYETLLLGGLPDEGLARAGLNISSKVLIRAVSENTYLMKFAEPELYEYSGVWPKDPLTPSSKLKAALAPQLTIPIKFQYTNGIVGQIEAPEGVSTLVLNIYRGILNILQLNIKKTHNVYDLQEAGTQGVCKTLYSINEDLKAERILLTKTRDLNHCQEEVIKNIGLAYTETCDKCQKESKNLRGTTSFSYTLKPSPSGTMIMKAAVSELIQFLPLSEVHGAVQMETKQRLVFLEIAKDPIPSISAQYTPRGSIKYEFSTELLQTPLQLIKISNLQAQVVEILNHLVSHNVEKVHEEAPMKFLELIQLLRTARYEDLEMFWGQFKKISTHRHWFLDAIPATGTPPVLRFIKEKFVADDLSLVEASQALVAAVHMVSANLETIKLVETLSLEPKILENPILREIVLLGYGTMISKYCAETPACPVELIKPIQDRLSEAVSKREIENIILFVKILGNAGHPSSLKSITKIIPIHGTTAVTLPLRVHVEAILALRNIAKKEPRRVQELALQLYMDKALHPELRMLSCIVLFETSPSMGLVTTVANIVKTEKNLQVASFTYSHMKSLSRSPSIIHPSLAAACSVAMKVLGPKLDRLSMRFSRAVHVDLYDSSLMLGAAATAFYINDAATLLPRSVVAKTRAFLAGAAADVLEIGVRTDGLQEALLKNPSITERTDRITKMKRILKALSQWRSLPTDKPLASLYVKVFGQEIAFANIEKTLIEEAITYASGPSIKKYGREALETLLLSGVSLSYAKPVLAAEVRRILPTAAGLPLELSLYSTAVAAAVVKIKPTTQPPLSEGFPIVSLLETDIQLETEVEPSVAMNTFAVMGINTPIIQATMVSRVKLNSIVPSKIAARLDIKEGDFKIEVLPVSVPENITSLNVETFAVVRNIEDLASEKITPIIPLRSVSSEILSSVSSITSISEEAISMEVEDAKLTENKIRLLSKRYCAQYVGIGLKACIKVATKNAGSIRDIALYKVAGSHHASLSITPIEGEAVEKLQMEVRVGVKAAEKLIRQINLSEEIIEETPVLMKLNKILASSRKSSLSGSSSSSSSIASSSSSRSSSSGSINSSSRRSSKSSSASTLTSLFSAGSSSSSSSIHRSRQISHRFEKDHKKAVNSAMYSKSKSSDSSFEAIYRQNKFLGNEAATVVAIFQAVRADKKLQGYQLSAYLDKPSARLQIVFAPLSTEYNWKICVDGVVLSKHKVTAKISWGANCKEYSTMISGETGLVESSPAARLRMSWERLPSSLRRYGEMVYKYVPAKMLADLIKGKNSTRQLSFTVIAASEKALNFTARLPVRTVYNMTLSLPITLPLKEIKTFTPFDEVIDKAHYVFAKAVATQCRSVEDTLITFNNRSYTRDMPQSCYQVLAQDCTEELKFMVLLMKDSTGQSHINVKIANIDIDLFSKIEVAVKVNGRETTLPYDHPTDGIVIRKTGEGISVYAPSHGLQEVYVDQKSYTIKVVDWMKGKTCGLCGKADGEIREEYRTPNGRVSKNAVSFAHSWTLSAESCRDNSECRLKLESVQLEKQVNIEGENSRCFSVEPVLRCLPGCFPVKTTPVTVGFNCMPSDSAPERTSSIFDSSVDLRETTEAHLACSCTAQCA
ncbi:vitellogenin-1-like [Cololabis saira]|uniref:vitellogenin-1-like n=1 Tax=Cololabis saira TaxID=129043 RepID=UPI002AD5AFA8|nr:vitellogenin-1-like [Cololabis saira]